MHFQFDVFAPSWDNGSAFAEFSSIAGWQNINGSPKLHESDIPAVEITPVQNTPTLPVGLFSQTLDAGNYRGKTVAVEMEIQCHEESLNEAGVFVWASRHVPQCSGRATQGSSNSWHPVAQGLGADGSSARRRASVVRLLQRT